MIRMMRDYSDFYNLFDEHKAAFDASTTFEGFCDAIGATHLKTYTWAPPVYATAKAGKRTYRPLTFPTVDKFSDLFESAVFVETKTNPQGYKYLAGDASLSKHVGGTRGWSKTQPDIRSHYGAKFFGTYVKPRAAIERARVNSFEAIRRTDGILILTYDRDHIECNWLALLPLSENVESLFDDATREFLANERQADKDAWGE
jgi:hypothetical protein